MGGAGGIVANKLAECERLCGNPAFVIDIVGTVLELVMFGRGGGAGIWFGGELNDSFGKGYCDKSVRSPNGEELRGEPMEAFLYL